MCVFYFTTIFDWLLFFRSSKIYPFIFFLFLQIANMKPKKNEREKKFVNIEYNGLGVVDRQTHNKIIFFIHKSYEIYKSSHNTYQSTTNIHNNNKKYTPLKLNTHISYYQTNTTNIILQKSICYTRASSFIA